MTRLYLLLLIPLLILGCEDDDDPVAPTIEAPTSYSFERDGVSTVSFSGQTARIAMAEELIEALKDPNRTELELDNMFRNEGPNGEDVAPFADTDLNASNKSIRSKTAASEDYFAGNATDAADIKTDFDGWIAAQVAEVFPRWQELSAPGQAGQIADGSSTRYVNGDGLEYDQLIGKGLIGALMLDQALNNYLIPAVLDAGSNRQDNDAGQTADGKAYTTMEHKWDEAYGYVFGAAPDAADPLATLGENDSFLDKYLGRVENDADFAGTAATVYRAFAVGRAAIVAGDYDERDRQADIIQDALSRIIGIRSTYYLATAAASIENEASRGPAFHDLSEAYGFIYSLQFTRDPATGAPYYSRAEVGQLLQQLTAADNGLWNVDPATLRQMGLDIANRFDFDYNAAAN